jgi:hypothetical protein
MKHCFVLWLMMCISVLVHRVMSLLLLATQCQRWRANRPSRQEQMHSLKIFSPTFWVPVGC